MDTRLGNLSRTPVSTGLPASWPNPIKPEWFIGKHEARLGRTVGIAQFGVNHIILDPGAFSALRHWHENEDEFILVLTGEATLIDENGEHALAPGDFVGFPAGSPNAHHLANRSGAPTTFLVVGTRRPGQETIHYPDDNLGPATVVRDSAGERVIP